MAEGRELKLGGEPTTPPPDPDQPWLWTGDESIGKKGWILVITDTGDGVPESLDDLD